MAWKDKELKATLILAGMHPYAANRGAAYSCMSAIRLLRLRFPKSTLIVGNHPTFDTDPAASRFKEEFGGDEKLVVSFPQGMTRAEKLVDAGRLHAVLWLCVLWRILMEAGLDVGCALRRMNGTLGRFLGSDLVMDLKGGDDFTDSYGAYYTFIWFHESAIPILLGKPYILLPQTIGPFQGKLARKLAEWVLDRTWVVMVRGQSSHRYVLDMGVDPGRIHIVPDLAFYPIGQSSGSLKIGDIRMDYDIRPGSRLFAIILRQVGTAGSCRRTHEKYMDAMVRLAEYMLRRPDCTILLIPHDGADYSRDVFEDFLSRISDRRNVRYLNRAGYTAEDLRRIIGGCDLLLSAYMHACVSAVSEGTPAIYLAYSGKGEDVLSGFGPGARVFYMKDLDYDALRRGVEEAWNLGESSRIALKREAEAEGAKVLSAVDIVSETLMRGMHTVGRG